MVGVYAGVVLHHTHVGDEAASEHLDAGVVSHNSLRYGAHTHGVHTWHRDTVRSVSVMVLTKLPQHLQLGHSLVVWPPHHHVDPLPHDPVQVEGPRYLLPNVTELFVVKVVGGEKPWAEPAVIGTWMK